MTERTRLIAIPCELCRRPVDADTADRARRSWRPLVVCVDCVRGARPLVFATNRPIAAAAAA